MFDWNDLRFFLELQRSGRLLTAAQRLKTTHATVARHIEAIEKSLGTALFVQHAQGYELTPSGEALLKHAEAMENVALLAEDELTHCAAPLGKIRLGVYGATSGVSSSEAASSAGVAEGSRCGGGAARVFLPAAAGAAVLVVRFRAAPEGFAGGIVRVAGG